VATAKGASDHPSSLVAFGAFRDGNINPQALDACQRPKRELLGLIQSVAGGAYAFPGRVPLALVQIDDTLIAHVPFEVTITAGARIKGPLLVTANDHRLGAEHAVIAGLSNGYAEYVTTPEEYKLQHYEGASNLYGPLTASLLRDRLTLLARAMGGVSPQLPAGAPSIDEATRFQYATGPVRSRLPGEDAGIALEKISQRGSRGLCRMAVMAQSPGSVCFWWKDGAPGRVPLGYSPWVRRVRAGSDQTVAVCGSMLGTAPCARIVPVDDRGLDFMTRVVRREGDGWIWATVFKPTQAQWKELAPTGTRVQFSIRAAKPGATPIPDIVSPPFAAPGAVDACTFEQARACRGER
jgi:antitoxin (DNA-binding transcriptional repressor) of toxin-antitoxin stability system